MRRWIVLALLLALWGSRLHALQALPLHNDEGLHLTCALEVWNLHPFWEISDGKIINHWPIALFDPRHATDFVGRSATILVALPGLAAGYALVRRLYGPTAAFLAGVCWLTSPYLFFFERLALSNAEAGALVVLALWAALRLARTARLRDALGTGLALALAALFKLTAAPFALTVALVVLLRERAVLRKRVAHLLIIAAVGAACFALPLIYLAQRGDLFSIALGWTASGSGDLAFGPNASRLWMQLTGYERWAWLIALLGGLILLTFVPRREAAGRLDRRSGPLLVSGLALPLLLILAVGSNVLPRHFVVALPLALTLAGAGWGAALDHLPPARWRRALAGGIALLLVADGAGFALTAYRDVAHLTLPDEQRRQYVTDHSAGFGLREAVGAFAQTISTPGAPIIASMFPDSCRRANFYAAPGYALDCPPAPGQEAIQAALDAQGMVYVLAEAPPIGLDFATLDGTATRLAAYPRPGETAETASVVLWRVER